MALVLDATVGGANSNAYLDATAAQALIDAIPNAGAWTSASPATREQALVRATTVLEAVGYQGQKVSPQQALAWPRFAVRDPDFGDVDAGSAWGGESAGGVGWVWGGGMGVYLDSTAIPRRVQRACVALALEILRAGSADVLGVDDTVNLAALKAGPVELTFTDPARRKRGLRAYPQVWREIAPLTAMADGARVQRG